MRSGKVRILLAYEQKMKVGTNVQDRLIASHDIDCSWRPSDLEQRAGRIIRHGNSNPEVRIYRYVTENTFGACLYQLVETKQKFVRQVMTSKTPVRSTENVDQAALFYAEIKMLAMGNPHIKEKMDLDIQVQNLRMLQRNYYAEMYELEDKVTMEFPREESLQRHTSDYEVDKVKNGTYLVDSYCGFNMEMYIALGLGVTYVLAVKGAMTHKVELGTDAFGNLIRIDDCIDHFNDLSETEKQLEIAKVSLKEPFSRE